MRGACSVTPILWEMSGRLKEAGTRRSDEELSSLYEALGDIPDYRRAQGRKHTVQCVLAIYILSALSGNTGTYAAAQFAGNLSQKELALLGAWYNREKQRYEAPSNPTMHRVIRNLDTQKLEAVVSRFTTPQIEVSKAVAVDGKRIRGANRNAEGHYEVVTLVDHVSGVPLGSLDLRDEGAEIAAVLALLEVVCVEGRMITLDALHTTKNTARAIVETHGADYMFTVKGNSPTAYEKLKALEWDRDAAGCFTEKISKGRGRMEQRSIDVMNAHFRMIDYPHAKQVFRVRRWAKNVKTGKGRVSNTPVASRRQTKHPRSSCLSGTGGIGRRRARITTVVTSLSVRTEALCVWVRVLPTALYATI